MKRGRLSWMLELPTDSAEESERGDGGTLLFSLVTLFLFGGEVEVYMGKTRTVDNLSGAWPAAWEELCMESPVSWPPRRRREMATVFRGRLFGWSTAATSSEQPRSSYNMPKPGSGRSLSYGSRRNCLGLLLGSFRDCDPGVFWTSKEKP